MKLSFLFGTFVFIWLIIALIIVGIMGGLHDITFGLYNPNFGEIGYLAALTLKYWYVSLGILLLSFVVGVLPTPKEKALVVIVVLVLLVIFLLYQGFVSYGIPIQ